MIKLTHLFYSISILFFNFQLAKVQEATQAHKDSLNAIVKQYYELNLKVFQANSTVEDIDNIFALFTPEFVYIHPKYGGTYTREDLYNGYTRNQKNGGYNGDVVDIKIENKILGLNAATVEKRFVRKNEESNLEMTLFEFKNGKISKIFKYW